MARAEYFAGIGTGVRSKEQAGSDGLGILNVYTFSFGWVSSDWSALLEASQTRHESGAGNVLVSSRQLDSILWIRRHLSPGYWHPYVTLGGGVQQAAVETHFNGDVTTNQGEKTNVIGLGIGFQSQVEETLNFGFDLRYLNGSQLRTVTSFESVSRLIYQF
jgi:hypothetical protein